MQSLRHNLRVCFMEKLRSVLEIFILVVFQTIPLTSKAVISLWVLAHKVTYIFEYIFWILHWLVMKIGDTVMEKIFRKYFAWFAGLSPKSRPFLISCSSVINQKAIMMSFWYLPHLKVANTWPNFILILTRIIKQQA